ncbi:DNA repair exonuclease [Cypionkella sp.]|uniref:metallophosphoesterase family protein n=1 Tax=Cypionkella sp. TaxID=2811411 RepID=UPI00260F921F|nr:DNA repair exonuclease [Cypionkella sp.]
MAFRFIHTADLHLDSPLVSLALRNADLADQVGVASRSALTKIVDLSLAEAVDAVLIAGDLWDGGLSSAKTARFLKQELLRLEEAGIRCFIIRGNHDAISKVTRELDPPAGTLVFGPKAKTVTFEVAGHLVAVHGVSFAEPIAVGSLLPLYPVAVAGAFNIGMMHTSLNGSARHDVYAPCNVADLDAHGYDYWALGHIHRRSEHRGRATVVMPGIAQGRDIGEAGACTVTLVAVDDQGNAVTEERSVAALRFDRLRIDLADISEWAAVILAVDSALRDVACAPRAEPHLVLRPMLVGSTPLAWRLARDLDRLTEEAHTVAASVGGIWIDKLENSTTSQGAGITSQLPVDLVGIVMADLPNDPALLAALAEAARVLMHDLPPELRDLLGDDADAVAAARGLLLADGSAQIVARLSASEVV